MTYKEAMKLYPDVPGCTDCYYWRLFSNGALYNQRDYIRIPKGKASSAEPACHYGLMNHTYKETTEMGYECPYRKERK